LRFSIPQQSLDFFSDNPPTYNISPDVLEPSKEENPINVSPTSPPNQVEKETEIASGVQGEKPPPEPAATNDIPIQKQAGIELSTFERRQNSPVHRRQAAPGLPPRLTNPNPIPPPPPPPQPGIGVSRWFKSFTDNL